MELREQEENMEGYYYPHPKSCLPEDKLLKEVREKPDDPIGDHDDREWKEAIDKFDF